MDIVKNPTRSDYQCMPSKEIEKFFKKLSKKAYAIHKAMVDKSQADLKHSFGYDTRIRARGYFHLHPMYLKSKWLLDHIEFSLPVFQFDTVKDYQSRQYFKDLVYFNGNLKNRHDTCFEAVGFCPTITFDITMIVKLCTIEDGLFKEKKEVADVVMDKFNIIFEYRDEDMFNSLLRQKYNWNHLNGFYSRRTNPQSILTTYTTAQRWDVIQDEENFSDEQICCFPVDCWKDMLWTGNNVRFGQKYPLSNFIVDCLNFIGRS